MGYYTNYTLDTKETLSHEMEMEIVTELTDLDTFNGYAERIHEIRDCADPIYEVVSSDCHKWYDCFEEMTEISKKFPTIHFILEGHGEDWNDIWRAYFFNGKGEQAQARLEFTPPFWDLDA